MYSFNKWLDHWVEEQKRVECAPGGGLRKGRFPDDPPECEAADHACRAVAEQPRVSEGATTRRVRDFARFWMYHRSHPELQNISLAVARALLGAREERFSGYLTIREDLPSDWYLELPFVRRCWRLLWILDEQEHGDSDDRKVLVTCDAGTTADNRYAGLSFAWSLIRELDMSPESARVNMRAMLFFLIEAGMLVLRPGRVLSERARGLIAAGSPGSFYKALLVRTFNRCIWDREDGLPPLVSIQLNGLYLLYIVHARFREPEDTVGTSARYLAERITALNRVLRVVPDPSYWIRDEHVLAHAIHHRFLTRIGRILGLIEPIPDLEGQSASPVDRVYRTTPFAERILLWNP